PSHPRRPNAKTRVGLDRCLQCVPSGMQGSTVDRWAAEWCRCRASRKSLNHTTSVEHVAPLPTWKTYRPVPEMKRYTADPARHSTCSIAKEVTGTRPVPRPPPLRPGRSYCRSLAVWCPRPPVVHFCSSPSTSLDRSSPFSSLSPTSSRPSGFSFSSTFPVPPPLSASFFPCTRTRPSRPLHP
ncbi:unnamed protein product, partial [Laminaria digitata]